MLCDICSYVVGLQKKFTVGCSTVSTTSEIPGLYVLCAATRLSVRYDVGIEPCAYTLIIFLGVVWGFKILYTQD